MPADDDDVGLEVAAELRGGAARGSTREAAAAAVATIDLVGTSTERCEKRGVNDGLDDRQTIVSYCGNPISHAFATRTASPPSHASRTAGAERLATHAMHSAAVPGWQPAA